MKYQFPEGTASISFAGQEFPADADGCADLPDDIINANADAIAAHGLVPFVPAKKRGKGAE